MLFKMVSGVCSIKSFCKNMGDHYYEPTIVVHDDMTELGIKFPLQYQQV